MWLIMVDAKSKWPEGEDGLDDSPEDGGEAQRSSRSMGYLNRLSRTTAQFIAEEFKEFCARKAIQHVLTPPYHPNSNGEAERFVQTFKDHMEKCLRSGRDLENARTGVLFQYRTTHTRLPRQRRRSSSWGGICGQSWTCFP